MEGRHRSGAKGDRDRIDLRTGGVKLNGVNLLHAAAFKIRGLIMAPVIVTLAICTRGEIENDWVVWGLGLSLLLSGVAGRLWAQRYLRYRVAGRRAVSNVLRL